MTGLTTITVRVPLTIRSRPGRKMLVLPLDGTHRTRADPALLKALARAFRWKRMLEDGRRASISEIAEVEKVDRTYAGSILRLTLLSPDIVQAIMDGRQPPDLALPRLLEPWPVEWTSQRAGLLTPPSGRPDQPSGSLTPLSQDRPASLTLRRKGAQPRPLE